MNFYQHHIGDYLKDTVHLSLLEHGVYRRLMDVYYSREKPLPLEINDVYRLVCAVTNSEKKAVFKTLNEFFLKSAFGFTHKRCDEEIAKYKDKSLKAKESANARWNANALRTQSEGNAPITNNHNQYKEVSNTTYSHPKDESFGKEEKCPYQEIISLYHELLPNHPKVRELTDMRRRNIKARWANGMEKSLEEFKGYFLAVSRSKFLSGKVDPPPGRKRFIADLDFLMREKTYVGILEGKYS